MSELNGPRLVILVSCRGPIKDLKGDLIEKDNIITLAWHMPVSHDPEVYAICVAKEHFSNELINKSNCFVVNFISKDYKKEAVFCGRHSGRFIDKFKECKLTKKEAEKIDCPVIGESCAHLECHVINKVDAGDHTIFIGKILNSSFKEMGNRLLHIGGDEFTYNK